jgi:hypothetical protein
VTSSNASVIAAPFGHNGFLSRRVEARASVLVDILAFAIGVLVIFAALNDVFQTAIVPRAVGRRLRVGYYVWRWAWYVWPKVAWRIAAGDAERREDLLALFAPAMLMVLPIIWLGLLIVGFGAIFWSLRHGISPALHTFLDGAYFAGTSITTIGFGDIVGRSFGARFFSILAAATGLGLFSIITAFLFSLFGSFQARETFVVLLGARTGVPPSGVDLLTVAGHGGTTANLPTLMIDAQRWVAQVMESHLAYPALAYFRSSHDYQSWVGTLGTLLDAATLLITTIDDYGHGQARVLYDLGRHATHDLAGHLGIEWSGTAPGLERSEFERACRRLGDAGYRIGDTDAAWHRFAALRGAYAPQLDGLARFFAIPPLQWIGDRSPLARPH